MKNLLKNIKILLDASLLICLSTFFIFCQNTNKNESETAINKSPMTAYTDFKFNLKQSDKIIDLPFELQEISSIAFLNDNSLLCIQDESADLYIFDFQKEQIIKHLISNEIGDYEGVEIVGSDLYVLKSNGNIMESTNFMETGIKFQKFKTALGSINDAEGLGYDSMSNSLLIACKNQAYIEGANSTKVNVRNVYQFNLANKTLNEKPFLSIMLDELLSKYGIEKFMPSGIAVHPKTHEFYIISAVGSSLIVVDRNGQIIFGEKLIGKIFRQAEGICFSPDGEKLFISNEGKNKKANILIFHSK